MQAMIEPCPHCELVFGHLKDCPSSYTKTQQRIADLKARNARLSKALEEALEWLRSTPEGRFTPQVNNQPGLWAFHADAALTVSDRKAGERLRKLELVARRAESWRIINENCQCSEFEEDAALEYLRSALTDLAAVGAASAKDD